jgi:hypothetical protein
MSNKPGHPQNNPSPGPPKPGGEKESTKRHVWIESGVEIDLAENLRKKYEASQTQANTHNEKTLWWTKAGAGLVFIYVLLTLGLFCLTRKSINNNSGQFQIDQRPYLWTSNKTPYTGIRAGQRMWANIELIDYGKSPALRAAITGRIFVGPSAEGEADTWFTGLGDKPIVTGGNNELPIPPGIPSVFPNMPASEYPGPEEAEKLSNAMPPGGFGGGGFFTLMSDAVLDEKAVDYVMHTDESVRIVMRLQYFDGFGNRYWSDICLSRFVSGAMPNCLRHNEMH